MRTPGTASAPANGVASAGELFALTDEQILEIEPLDTNETATVEQPLLPALSHEGAVPLRNAGKDEAIQSGDRSAASTQSVAVEKPAQALRGSGQTGVPVLQEPPAWLARQMKDPWVGEEARELWDGVLRAQGEAAEYRTAIATPAEAKSLKEIYPGGVEQARAAANRARTLDEFDAAYFGVAGKSGDEVGTARAALAQRMLREDPVAFEAMVLAGVKALEEAKKPGSNEATTGRGATPTAQQEVKSAPTQSGAPSSAEHDAREAQLVAYTEFEKAANTDLEKSVGGAIEGALRQALPNARSGDGDALTMRLSAGVRQEIEKALQADRQLGEQVAQVLSSRRFDETARAQVVRLINERAQQLVPSATKRVLNDWTQTTLAAHRSKTEKQEGANQRADLAPAQPGRERATAGSQQRTASRADAPPPPRGRIDYKKLTDEQIVEL